MQAIETINACYAVLATENIDTDQIIPAKFLTVTTREGLGENAFYNWRYQSDGSLNPDFPFNQADKKHCEIIVAGHNFGCGSSREHAPWSLQDMGIKAIISSQIADIFKNNCLKNGLLPIVVEPKILEQLMEASKQQILIDLPKQTIDFQGQIIPFEIDGFAKHCLLNGIDQLGYLLQQSPAITAFERNHDKN